LEAFAVIQVWIFAVASQAAAMHSAEPPQTAFSFLALRKPAA
jgi:hypothetical protein